MVAPCLGYAPYTPHKNLIGKPNVFVPELRAASQTHTALYEALAPLVSIKRDWRFVVDNARKSPEEEIAIGFSIFCNSENLGSVSIKRRGDDYKLFITNDRILESLVRGRGLWTSDPKRATLIIRKKFYPAGIAARTDKALGTARCVANSLTAALARQVKGDEDKLYLDMRDFALSNQEAFTLTLPDIKREALHAYMENREKLKGVNAFRYKLTQNNVGERVMLVIIDQDNYIVRLGDEVSLHTADTLSQDVRTKLGMLKLAEPDSIFPDIGCRVSSDTFLITCTD
jgi:hypothetical protein